MRRISDSIDTETVFPVFKTDFSKKITYTNLSAIPVLNEWGCYEDHSISAQMLDCCPELGKLYNKPESGSLTLYFKGYALSFIVKPFPEQGYIGFYGFQIKFIDQFDNAKILLN